MRSDVGHEGSAGASPRRPGVHRRATVSALTDTTSRPAGVGGGASEEFEADPERTASGGWDARSVASGIVAEGARASGPVRWVSSLAEAISAQERARAAGAVAASGVFSDAAGVGTFASSSAAMARRGGGAERGSAGDIPFPGETRPVCERRTRSLAGSAGSLSGSLAGGRRPRGRGCGVGARVSRTPRGIRACVDARGRSERPRRPSIGVPERWVSRKQCVT